MQKGDTVYTGGRKKLNEDEVGFCEQSMRKKEEERKEVKRGRESARQLESSSHTERVKKKVNRSGWK